MNEKNKMNRIILIGNGFDLAHGLKTSYADFINWFWQKQLGDLIEKWQETKKGISSKYEKSRFKYENDLFVLEVDRLDTSQFSVEGLPDEEKARKTKENVRTMKGFIVSYKNKFIEKIEAELTITNWVDIEELYFRQLLDCKNRFEKENYNIYTVQQLNNDFRFVKDNLKEYLQKIEEDRDGNEDFEKFQRDKRDKLKKNILDPSCGNETVDKILLLNFNYLNTEDLYKKLIEKENKRAGEPRVTSIHIHGNIKDTDDSMIFGYGDEMSEDSEAIVKMNNNNFLENVKSIKYVESLNYQKLLAFVKESEKYEVFTMGHSCGNSDRTLLNYLFQNPKCKRIKIFYYEQFDGSNNYKEIATNIYRDFELDEKAAYRDKVCPPEYATTSKDDKVTSEPLQQYNDKKENFGKVIKDRDMLLVEFDANASDLKTNYYIGKFPVTQKQWQEIMGYNDSWFQKSNEKLKDIAAEDIENFPVENVSWYDAVLFCNMLSEKCKLGKYYDINGDKIDKNKSANGFRLPTEAEWEYAAKGGKKSKGYEYSGGNNIDEVAWYDKNSESRTHQVGEKQANELGLYDMSGNVWEWCENWYDENHAARVVRGGSWIISAGNCRVSRRLCTPPDDRFNYIGFRLVLPQL